MVEPELGRDVKIGRNVTINVTEHISIGDRSVINDGAVIEGRHIDIGCEAWLDKGAYIGGGSCFDLQSKLIAGDWLHMGKGSHINTARKVVIGDECGVGIGTNIFTHGAYLSAYEGFPVTFEAVSIGDRVWLPHAWVNPGVHIGSNVVVAAMSLVNRDLPAGCLAGGIPVKVLKENVYPRKLTLREKTLFVDRIAAYLQLPFRLYKREIRFKGTIFNMEERTIEGPSTEETERIKNQLRRCGIRFRFYADEGEYRPW